MTKILIIGGTGMLGHKLVQRLSPGFEVACTVHRSFEALEPLCIFDRQRTFENVDVLAFETVQHVVKVFCPDVVVNAVGMVKQLPGSADVEKTLAINAIFPHKLAKLGNERDFRLITISTDCVFNGSRGGYTEKDVPDALDLYGQSKHWGEISLENCLTLRTSIIGRELWSHHGLIEWFLSQRGKCVKGFSNAIYTGFPTLVFADILIDIIERHPEIYGVFHLSSNPISKYELLQEVNALLGVGVDIVKDVDFVLDRSLDSSKFRQATGFEPQAWDEMIARMASDETPYNEWNDRIN